MLQGRDGELATVERLLTAARGGVSGVLVVRGEPGIGKTALLDHAASGDMPVLRGAGVESEAELPYAGLTLLLRAALAGVAALPPPQRRALEVALGLATGESPDAMLVGLAVLSLLAEHAGDGPLLVVADDAQWLDRASAGALVLASRRLHAEGIVMLFGVRDGEGAFDAPGLPELRLDGLAPDAADALLDPGLPPGLRARVLAEAHGNPLALVELPRALAAEPPGASSRPGALPLTSRLRLAFHGRAGHLPRPTQTMLAVAAVDDTGDLGVVLSAAATLGAGAADLASAEEAGLVRTDGATLVFRHPLVRAAIHSRTPLDLRLAAHRALAAALTGPGHADRRAWHLAAAATGPDETVAAELERTAGRARARGGHTAAAVAFERAAALGPDDGDRTRRLARAAESFAEAGQLDRARSAARGAAEHARDPGTRTRLLHVLALADFWQGDFPAAHRRLLDGARQAAPADPAHAARLLVQAVHTAWYLGERDVADTIERLTALDLPGDEPARPAAGFIAASLGPGGRAPALLDAVARVRALGPDTPYTAMMCAAGLATGQDDDALALTTALADDVRADGGIGRLPTVLFFRAEAETFTGRHRDALTTGTEALAIARDTGQRQWISQFCALLAHLAALDGDEERCRALADEAVATTGGGVVAPGTPWAWWARGLLDLGQGRARTAWEHLERLTREPFRHHIAATRAVPDLVETAVRLGDPDRAREPLARLTAWAAHAGRPWADAVVLRCRALLASDGDAEALWEGASERHHLEHRPFEQARTRLLHGEWLRRTRRRTDARGHLAAALETFESLGARPWADRARTELAATGTPVPARAEPGVLAALTPQELQIVRLAAQGHSNRDIAARLFLSHRTVGHHLYKAYPKLGVLSRGELAEIDGLLP